jgi:stearoyl-CoA desaturase (delta-9 desaturase)
MTATIEQGPAPRPPAAGEPAVGKARRAPDERVNKRSSIPFVLLHFLPLLAFITGITWRAVAVCVAFYVVRMLAITGGYHRYFAHRTYRLRRFPQFVLAFFGASAAQKGPLWWAAHHRAHHKYSDTEKDIHSPKRGFWWSHVGWILCDKYNKTDTNAIKDFAKYPELVWLDKHDWVAPWTLGFVSYFTAGWSGLLIGFFLSTVLLWHGTFTINSLAHVWGRRAYETTDTSRNNAVLAVITGGEGWHNNHHRYPWAARQGFRWWQVDVTYYVLRVLGWLGIVHDIRGVPVAVRDEARRLPTAA